ncbi:response regulator transcription factor [Alkalihalobacillus hemicellulosilyticus]|uniref:Two-component response regulator yesN n=1 Tax=Halalkalibacter hemicellulosilyticusJCM 9152 TaxID=1236971 RepID=W4QKF0_9BACI|nr:response regulator [Halalkalibacter hemicellulosilyticus]GAE32113.1 two-component response regulator yesN [Halalkalibacter hemicellulosilyticusJCM 9152]
MKAMIVDDEKHVREGLRLLAEWERFGIKTVLEAEDGEEAMQVIAKEHPQIIFTDMRMPKKDGVALMKWLYTSNWKAKTIVVSGYDDFRYLKETITYQGFDYLLKPINPTELNETLQRAVSAWNEQYGDDLQTFIDESNYQKEPSTVHTIADYLRKNYKQELKLQDIADRFYLSREYISRRFKQEYHQTITDFITSIRMEKAKELLRNPDLKVYEIADAVGYPNDKYFAKLFKKQEA